MASEMLSEILKAETNAAEAQRAAKKQAEDIINQANKNAEVILLNAQKKSADAVASYLAAAKKESGEIVAAATAEALADGEAIKTAAGYKHGDAIEAVKKYILP